MRPVLVVIALLVLPATGAEAAATVSATSHVFPDYRETGTQLSVEATGDAGADTLGASMLLDADGVADGVRVTDAAGAIAAVGCEQVDATTVQCVVRTPDLIDVTLNGGEGDDILDGSQVPSAVLEGGPGADRLIAPRAIHRSPFRGPTMDGGPGPDTFVGDGLVTYASRAHSVHVDLRSRGAVQGEAGEGDTIDGPRAVTGGRGDDVLVAGAVRAQFHGGPGDDHLVGGRGGDNLFGDGGADTLDGRGGDDNLLAGTSREGDTLRGGAGNDRLLPSPGPDVLAGGAGVDALTGIGRGDVARGRDGEADELACIGPARRVDVDALDLVLGCARRVVSRRGAPRPRITRVGRAPDLDFPADGRTALVGVGCPVDMPVNCVVEAVVRDRSGPAGHARVVARPGFVVDRVVALSTRASRHARCTGHLRLTYTLTFSAADGSVIRLHRRHSEPVRRRASAC